MDVLEALEFLATAVSLAEMVLHPLLEFEEPVSQFHFGDHLFQGHKEVRIVLQGIAISNVYIVNVDADVDRVCDSAEQAHNGFFDENGFVCR